MSGHLGVCGHHCTESTARDMHVTAHCGGRCWRAPGMTPQASLPHLMTGCQSSTDIYSTPATEGTLIDSDHLETTTTSYFIRLEDLNGKWERLRHWCFNKIITIWQRHFHMHFRVFDCNSTELCTKLSINDNPLLFQVMWRGTYPSYESKILAHSQLYA